MSCNITLNLSSCQVSGSNGGIEFNENLMDSELFCILASVIGFVGLVGNTLILILLFRDKVGPFTMLLISLAISDTLFIISMVSAHYVATFHDVIIPVLLDWFLPIIRFAMGMSSGVASYIGIERFFATYQPILHRLVSNTKTTGTVLGVIFTIHFTLTIIDGSRVLAHYQIYVRLADEILRRWIPTVIIFLTNISTGILLARYNKVHKKLSASSKKELSITKTMFAVIVTYFLCMLPGSIHIILIDAGVFKLGELKVLFRTGFAFEIVNASCNFIIYILTSKYYQTKFMELLSCKQPT